MTKYQLKNSTPSHTDITRLRRGGVSAQVNEEGEVFFYGQMNDFI